MKRMLSDVLLFLVAVLLLIDLFSISRTRVANAAPAVVRVETGSNRAPDGASQSVVGSCVNKGAYTECLIASR